MKWREKVPSVAWSERKCLRGTVVSVRERSRAKTVGFSMRGVGGDCRTGRDCRPSTADHADAAGAAAARTTVTTEKEEECRSWSRERERGRETRQRKGQAGKRSLFKSRT